MERNVKQKIPLVEELKEALIKKGWNNATLAREANVSPVVISRLFSGSTNIKIDNLQKILNCLSMSLPIPTDKAPPGSSQENELLLNVINSRIDDLSDRVKRQGNALEIAQNDASSALKSVNDLSQRLSDYAMTKDLRKLKRAG